LTRPGSDEWRRLVERAYEAILARVTAGRASSDRPSALVRELLHDLDGRRARELAADVVRHARAELVRPVSSAPEDRRETARRQRVYAISRRIYDDVRVGGVGSAEHSYAVTEPQRTSSTTN
jgi:hypothetical protein